MGKTTFDSVMSGTADNNIRFNSFVNLMLRLDFEFQRQNGSHAIYYNAGIREFMNVQKDGSKAKAYQVEQLRKLILKYKLKEK